MLAEEMFKQGLRDVEGQDALLAWRELLAPVVELMSHDHSCDCPDVIAEAMGGRWIWWALGGECSEHELHAC